MNTSRLFAASLISLALAAAAAPSALAAAGDDDAPTYVIKRGTVTLNP